MKSLKHRLWNKKSADILTIVSSPTSRARGSMTFTVRNNDNLLWVSGSKLLQNYPEPFVNGMIPAMYLSLYYGGENNIDPEEFHIV